MARNKHGTPLWVHWCTYATLRLGVMIFQMFPPNLNLVTARVFGWLWFKLMGRHRRRATEHLCAALGDRLSDAQVARMARRSMQQMTMMAMELLFTPRRITEWSWPRHIHLKELGPALDVLLDERGAILLTAHFGNWELLGYVLATLGFPVHAVMRPLDNPYLNEYLEQTRGKRGLKLLYKKGAMARADDVLESGGALCFIADQDAGRKGIFVDFFGRPASTYKSIGLLAIKHRVPVVVGYAKRTSMNFEYQIRVNRVIHPHEWHDREDELHWLTQEFSRAMEDFVREAPDQYLWMHRRWKTQPSAGTRTGAAATTQTRQSKAVSSPAPSAAAPERT
ncbi:MAG: lysophospholipid acyltransferase family protein [Phycisphaerales bacterium]|nr:MAG: lysophospholipid acyltransferase family protein [Phycisphaerales bacterium]